MTTKGIERRHQQSLWSCWEKEYNDSSRKNSFKTDGVL